MYIHRHLTVAIIGDQGSEKSKIASAICGQVHQPGGYMQLAGIPVYNGETDGQQVTVLDVPPLRRDPDAFPKSAGIADLRIVLLDAETGINQQFKEQIFALHWLDVDNIYFAVLEKKGVGLKKSQEFEQEIYEFIWDHSIDSEHYILGVSDSDVSDIHDLLNQVRTSDGGAADECFRMNVIDVTEADQGRRFFWGKVISGSAKPGDSLELRSNDQSCEIRIGKIDVGGKDRSALNCGDFAAVELIEEQEFSVENGCTLSSPGSLLHRSHFDWVMTIIFSEEEIGEKVEFWDGAEIEACFRFGLTRPKAGFPHTGDTLVNDDSAGLIGLTFPVPVPVFRDDQFFILNNGKVVGMGRIC